MKNLMIFCFLGTMPAFVFSGQLELAFTIGLLGSDNQVRNVPAIIALQSEIFARLLSNALSEEQKDLVITLKDIPSSTLNSLSAVMWALYWTQDKKGKAQFDEMQRIPDCGPAIVYQDDFALFQVAELLVFKQLAEFLSYLVLQDIRHNQKRKEEELRSIISLITLLQNRGASLCLQRLVSYYYLMTGHLLPGLEPYLGCSIRDYLDFKPGEIAQRTRTIEFQLSNLFINSLEGINEIPNFDKCAHLHLDHNLLTECATESFKGFSALTFIDLSFNTINSLGDFAFLGLNKLVSLNLSYNPLTEIGPNAFQGISTVLDLDLSMSRIVQLPEHVFDSLVHLKKLDLHGNQFLDSLPEGAFNHLVNLEMLELHKTGLEELWATSFHGLLSLQYLLLNNNQRLEFIDPRIFFFVPRLQVVDLRGSRLPVENIKQIEAIARSQNKNIRINF